MRAQWWSVPIPRHATLCDADSRGFIVVAFCSAILHHWMCKIPTEVATLTGFSPAPEEQLFITQTSNTIKVCNAWGVKSA
ncbi:hypothetical protein [Piscirickettsia salmonis]|uniref:hypothetical protein n=1 Tax=Piscirickettsia salmonis TaxID=1238 RepID=UPI0015CF18EA|nr:hypothetical protein [Piscirickettsia salmonis]